MGIPDHNGVLQVVIISTSLSPHNRFGLNHHCLNNSSQIDPVDQVDSSQMSRSDITMMHVLVGNSRFGTSGCGSFFDLQALAVSIDRRSDHDFMVDPSQQTPRLPAMF